MQLESAEEVDRVVDALSEGGVLMPLESYPWSPRYAWVRDRFGVTWQVLLVEEKPRATLLPCLMFVGKKLGKAAEAMALYTEVFEGGRVLASEHYAEGEGPTHLLKHGRCELAGQELVAFDAHGEHPFDFDEALSLQIMCEDQRQIDHYWQALTEGGGEEGPCGWLKDPFGVSWQVVPRAMNEWMTSSDTKARDRAFAALMKMKKLDVTALKTAFEGK